MNCIQTCNNKSKEEMLNEIMALNFAINDLTLYLDTHPTDKEAINMHCKYSEKQIELTSEYQKNVWTINYQFHIKYVGLD